MEPRKEEVNRLSGSEEDIRSISPSFSEDRRIQELPPRSASPRKQSSPTYPEDSSVYFNDRNSSKLTENWVLNLAQNTSKKQLPIDVLCRIFPSKKKSVLELVLQGCGGDTVQAIEQVLATQREEEKVKGGMMPNPISHAPLGSHVQNPMFKSAFSPISSFSAASSLNSIRYAWGGATGRGLALAMPYPHLLPGLSMGSTLGYHTVGNGADKISPYSMYPFWTGKPYASKELDKA